MLIQIDSHRQTATQLPGLAHIVVAIRRDGTLHMQAFRQGALNASYANKSDSVLAQIPALLAELRDELAADAAQLPVTSDGENV